MLKTAKLTKGKAFYFGVCMILGIVGVVAWRTPDALDSVANGAILGIVGLAASYSGANVLDNLQRSKYFVPELKEEQ